MNNFYDVLPYLTTIVIAIGGAYLTVKVTMAEMRKDIHHLKEKLKEEVDDKKEIQSKHEEAMKEVRDDVKAIFRTLTKIQVDIAKK